MKIIADAVPCHLVSGFLGSGKTTLIQHLLANKPKHERWAVLSNEFGEIGLDAALLEAQQPQQDVFIKEVPGGCLCCAAGVPFLVALNQLLKLAKPQRLIIEPTGLGHPINIKQRLEQLANQGTIQLGTSLALVDARVLADKRYTEHENFPAQLSIADAIVASKNDLYQAQDKLALTNYLHRQGLQDKALVYSQHGQLDMSVLLSPLAKLPPQLKPWSLTANSIATPRVEDNPEVVGEPQPFAVKQHHQDGVYSLGWQFPANTRFQQTALLTWLESLDLLRCKAVLQTPQATLLINQVNGQGKLQTLAPSEENRIELIASQALDQTHLSEQLLACCEP
ncbi:GTP-binding protein [Agarivorans sp. 1_MG-2023]|uniref:CobW family GTP-binding protein n=1 Tax=Agarivorans sp. 1_MG-2023 TaxID=3062634 RepID=UPI0026E40FA7|nr:GTP-binding protein [Agarivorans sp. 1_MG-2023]MDO6763017.1 GTP-binding protein [Agarivorans sp. 1_MG-2023]